MVDMVFVKAIGVSDFGDGVFGIQLPIRELSPDEAKLLKELFPHTERAMQALLTKEALLDSIMTDPIIPNVPTPIVQRPKGGDKAKVWQPGPEEKMY